MGTKIPDMLSNNPGGVTGLTDLNDHRAQPSIYVGETARSLKERSADHHADYRNENDDSHMLKHASHNHHQTENIEFYQYVVGRYKTSLSRQIAEAVRIQMRENALNSTGVYNRCRLTRLVVDSNWDK